MAQANIKAVITAEDRASGALKKFGTSVEKMNDKVVTGAKRAAVAFGAAGLAATTFAIKSAADFEQTRIGLENMLGSADKARAMLAKVSKFAAETPFEFPELAQATRQLVAFGFSGEDAFKTMTQLGDVSAAIGAPINDLAYLMGTLRAQGRAFTIDIRQFAMRGIPIYEYLAKVMKTNTKELTELIETGKIGFPEVQKAFQLMTQEGGKFHGTMAKQSKSLSGLFSTLKDVIGQTARELVGITQTGDVKEGSLFDSLRKGTAWLIDNLPRLISTIGEFLKTARDGLVPTLQQWWKNFTNVASVIADYLMPKLTALWNTIRDGLLPVLGRLWKEVLLPLIPVIGVLLVTAIRAVVDGLNLLLNIFVPVMTWLLDNKWAALGLALAFGTLAVAMKFNAIVANFNASMASVRATFAVTKAFITAPIFMPAIVVAAALASLGLVIQAIAKIRGAWDAANNAMNAGANLANAGQMKALQLKAAEARKRGDYAAVTRYANAISALAGGGATGGSLPSYAGGTNFHPGGMAIVGEQGPELVNLPRGSSVTPNGKSATTVNLNVNVGMYAGTEMEKRKIAKALYQSLQDAMGPGFRMAS